MEIWQAPAPISALLIFAAVSLSASEVAFNQANIFRKCVTRIAVAGQAAVDRMVMKAVQDNAVPPSMTYKVGALTPPFLHCHNMEYHENTMILKGERDDLQ